MYGYHANIVGQEESGRPRTHCMGEPAAPSAPAGLVPAHTRHPRVGIINELGMCAYMRFERVEDG